MKVGVERAAATPKQAERPRVFSAIGVGDGFRLASLALAASLTLAACEPAGQAPANPDAPPASPAAAAPSAGASRTVAAPAPEAVAAKTKAQDAATATQAVLERFAVLSAPGWDAFAALPGVTWSEAAPVPAPGAMGEDAMSRAGVVQWADIPTPAGAASQRDEAQAQREHKVGLTLLGREAVEAIAFRKYRPSTDYEAALHAQLGANAKLRRIADRCARNYGSRGANTRGSAFFELMLDDRAPLYVEGYADKDGGKYGPGYTTFEITRMRPDARIADMGCIES